LKTTKLLQNLAKIYQIFKNMILRASERDFNLRLGNKNENIGYKTENKFFFNRKLSPIFPP